MAQGVPTQWALVLAQPDLGDGRPVVAAHRRHRRLTGSGRAGGRHARARSGCRWSSATPRPRRHSAPAPSPATPTRWSPPPWAARCPGSSWGWSTTTAGRSPAGEVGRVRLRSAAVMRGYWGGPPTGPGAEGLVFDTAATGRPGRGRLADHRRLRLRRRRRPPPPGGPGQRALHPGRLQRLSGRGRGGARRPSRPSARWRSWGPPTRCSARSGWPSWCRRRGRPAAPATLLAELRDGGPGRPGRLQGARPGGGGRQPSPDLDDEGRQEGPGRAGRLRPPPVAAPRGRSGQGPDGRRTEHEHHDRRSHPPRGGSPTTPSGSGPCSTPWWSPIAATRWPTTGGTSGTTSTPGARSAPTTSPGPGSWPPPR